MARLQGVDGFVSTNAFGHEDEALETELRKRAEVRGCELVIEQQGDEWHARFEKVRDVRSRDPATCAVPVLEVDAPDRREALEGLVLISGGSRARF